MPIDLHERLSEFSYGYGVTREVEALMRAVGLTVTPFMPSLIHEAELNYRSSTLASAAAFASSLSQAAKALAGVDAPLRLIRT